MNRTFKKRLLVALIASMVLPMAAQAQTPAPGFYVGAEGGLNWLLNTTVTAQTATSGGSLNSATLNCSAFSSCVRC